MIVLLLIYIFQFDEVPIYVKRLFNISDEVLSSIGFEKFEMTDQLIIRLLTPTTFLIVIILQIHYFNEPWLKLTDKKLG
jgi:piezo-type mechanosensitive ion channel component 1/2